MGAFRKSDDVRLLVLSGEECPESPRYITSHRYESLGAFVPTNGPFIQTVPGRTTSALCIYRTDISCHRTVLEHPIAGAVGRSESALANGGE